MKDSLVIDEAENKYKSSQRCSIKKAVLKNLCESLCNFIKIETQAQVFSSQFCVISKSTFFTEHLRKLLL